MSLASTRIAIRLLAIVALAALTAGCFQPMYAEHTDGTPGLREKLLGVEVPPVDKANASREARVQVEIRNLLAFKMYGSAVGTAPMSRFVGPEPYLRAMMLEAGCTDDTVAQCHVAAPGSAGVLTRSPFAAKSDFFTTAVPAAGAAAMVGAVAGRQAMSVPGGGAITLDLMGGAVNEVPADATAFVHRNTSSLAQYSASWGNSATAATADASMAWLRQAWTAMRPFASGQAYQNYADDTLADPQRAYYGANLARLTEIRRTYDPGGVFTLPQGVPL